MINYLYQMKSRNIPDKTSTLDYINNRFAEERQGLYLSDKFIDEYKETATYNGIMPSSIKAVSYTHLDVYMRQGEGDENAPAPAAETAVCGGNA